LGQASLPSKRRKNAPMQTFDALPAPLRHWLGQATLPWSPASAKRIWIKARAQGLSTDDALSRLSQAEAKTLARDTYCVQNRFQSQP
jgi:hypothetical protein